MRARLRKKTVGQCSKGELETVIELLREAHRDPDGHWRRVWREEGLAGFLPDKVEVSG